MLCHDLDVCHSTKTRRQPRVSQIKHSAVNQPLNYKERKLISLAITLKRSMCSELSKIRLDMLNIFILLNKLPFQACKWRRILTASTRWLRNAAVGGFTESPMRPKRRRESITNIASLITERRTETTIVLHPQEKVSIEIVTRVDLVLV